MNTSWPEIGLFAWMWIMGSLFMFFGISGLCYSVSTFRLVRQVKNKEPELWISLGEPEILVSNPLGFSFNRILATQEGIRFARWFYTGAEGAELPKTKTMAITARRLCRAAMTGFISLSIGIFLPLVFALFLLIKNGTA